MTPFKALALAALLLAAAPAARAAAPEPKGPPVDVNPGSVQAGIYGLEPVHTRIMFSVSHLGFTTWYGDFSGASGELTVDPHHQGAAQVEVSVPVASVSTTNAKLDGELRSPAWFDAAAFPIMVFKSRKVRVLTPGWAAIEGDLTLRGVTKPLTLMAKFNGGGIDTFSKAYTIGFEGKGAIKRSDFGISKDIPWVGNEVTLFLSAAFVRKP